MCAIFGLFNVEAASRVTALALHSEQHRAIDYAGMVTSNGTKLQCLKGPGLARQVFTEDALKALQGSSAIGHLRYPTVSDQAWLDNIQPIMGKWRGSEIAIVHNGNITNVPELTDLVPAESITTSLDTELALRLIEAEGIAGENDIIAALKRVLPRLRGSYKFVLLLPDRLIAVSDPRGNRPLSLGRLNQGYCVASETCALTAIRSDYMCDVEPGTILSITKDNPPETVRFAEKREKKCRFEAIYYAHPSSTVFGQEISGFRQELGRRLEECCPVIAKADIVTSVPDSANFIAMGYGSSGRSGIFRPVIYRSHYVGRTFIAASQDKRRAEVMNKFSFSGSVIRGKSVVVVDDSIVRGTTMPVIVGEMRRLGASAVHVRVACPLVKYSCIYGINTPTKSELIANRMTVEEMRVHFGADSLEFLPLPVLMGMSPDPENYCFACMSGEYWDRQN